LVVRIDDGAVVDAPLGPQTFTLNVPTSATPMTLAELRALLRDR
jgi:hypothetical protein